MVACSQQAPISLNRDTQIDVYLGPQRPVSWQLKHLYPQDASGGGDHEEDILSEHGLTMSCLWW